MMPPSSWYRLEEFAQLESTMRRASRSTSRSEPDPSSRAGGVARSAEPPRRVGGALHELVRCGPIGRPVGCAP